ncbi:MAG: thermonuclease family protein [Beijerinckiaceae bacterium]|jgi:endonuclease YncB( thermonuclease family)
MAAPLSHAPTLAFAALAAGAGAFGGWIADRAGGLGPGPLWRDPAPIAQPARLDPAPALPRADANAGPRSAPGDILPGPFPAHMLRVIDGDTFEARVQVWLGQDVTTRVRLRGFDAPETRSPCAAERSLGEEARRALADALANGSIVLTDVSRDKFGGRVVASVRILRENGGDDLAQLMLAGGYGRPYAGGRRGPDACGS